MDEGDVVIMEEKHMGNAAKIAIGLQWRDLDRFVDTKRVDAAAKEAMELNEHGVNTIQLSDCVRAFTRTEELGLSDAWYCSQCKIHRQASKTMTLWRLPQILIIHLKRFFHTKAYREKIESFVDFPLHGLKLGDFSPNEAERKSNAVYDLFACSNHMGGMSGGHYTAFVRNPVDGHWYCHDDSRVRRMPERDVKSNNAYVLFYVRREPDLDFPQAIFNVPMPVSLPTVPVVAAVPAVPVPTGADVALASGDHATASTHPNPTSPVFSMTTTSSSPVNVILDSAPTAVKVSEFNFY